MLSEEQIRSMSKEERLRLLAALATMDVPELLTYRGNERRRAVALAVIVICCVVLAAWIAVLALTLPRYYRSGGWRGTWVGFDVAELLAFAATGWAAWRQRQILIICLVVLATLLCCDAWFDVVLDAGTHGFELSLLSAAVIELPLAAFAIMGARRLLRMTYAVIRRYEGDAQPMPHLWQARLVGTSPGMRLSDLFRETQAQAEADALNEGGPAGRRAQSRRKAARTEGQGTEGQGTEGQGTTGDGEQGGSAAGAAGLSQPGSPEDVMPQQGRDKAGLVTPGRGSMAGDSMTGDSTTEDSPAGSQPVGG